jgi:TolB protein
MIRKVFLATWLLALILLGISSLYAAQDETDLIAYSRLTDGYWQIWVMDLDKFENRQLTTSAIDKRCPIWIGKGKKIMYRTSNAEMFIVDTENKKETQVLDKFGVITDPAWSEVNKRLAFTRYEGYLKDESEIWTIQLDGQGQRVLTHEAGMQYNPAWSPDGNAIVYTSGKTSDSHQIWIMDKDGKNQKKLTENTGKWDILPVFSPDGEKIAFASNRKGSFDIWIMDKDGKRLKNLTKNEALDTKPSFSPDGKQIIFTSTRSGSLQLWVMNSNGTNPRQITDGESECQAASWIRLKR